MPKKVNFSVAAAKLVNAKKSSPKKKKSVGPKNRSPDNSVVLKKMPQNMGSISMAPINSSKLLSSYFRTSKGQFPDSIRCQGCDFLSAITWSYSSAAGVTLANILINPASPYLNNTRLQKYSQIYEKYCFKKLTFHVTAPNTTNSAGAFIIAYDKDPTDSTPTQNSDGVREFTGYQDNVNSAVWQSARLDCSVTDPQKFYYCGVGSGSSNEERLIYQGQVYVAVMTPLTIITSAVLNLWIEYDIELYDPQMQSPPEAAYSMATQSTTSTTTNAGFNYLVGHSANYGSTQVYPINFDGTNYYVNLPPGTHFMEWAAVTSSTAGSTAVSFVAYDTSSGASITPTAIAGTSNAALGVIAAAAGALGYIANTFAAPNGAHVYLTGFANALVLTQCTLRIYQIFVNTIY